MPNSHGPRKGTRHKLRNDPRDRGTPPPQRAVETFEEGERVHLSIDPSVPEGRYHPRFDGKTGVVEGAQGAAYKIRITDGNSQKTVIARPAHLRLQE